MVTIFGFGSKAEGANAAEKLVGHYVHAEKGKDGTVNLRLDGRIVDYWQSYMPWVLAAWALSQAVIPFAIGFTTTYLAGVPLQAQFKDVKNVWNNQNWGLQIVVEGLVFTGTIIAAPLTGGVAGAATGLHMAAEYPPQEVKKMIAALVGA